MSQLGQLSLDPLGPSPVLFADQRPDQRLAELSQLGRGLRPVGGRRAGQDVRAQRHHGPQLPDRPGRRRPRLDGQDPVHLTVESHRHLPRAAAVAAQPVLIVPSVGGMGVLVPRMGLKGGDGAPSRGSNLDRGPLRPRRGASPYSGAHGSTARGHRPPYPLGSRSGHPLLPGVPSEARRYPRHRSLTARVGRQLSPLHARRTDGRGGRLPRDPARSQGALVGHRPRPGGSAGVPGTS